MCIQGMRQCNTTGGVTQNASQGRPHVCVALVLVDDKLGAGDARQPPEGGLVPVSCSCQQGRLADLAFQQQLQWHMHT